MKYKLLVALLLSTSTAHAAVCHKYSRWYYPFPQNCKTNRYTAEIFKRMKFRIAQPATFEAKEEKPILKWAATSPYPQIDVTPNIVCTMKMSDADLNMCLLRIELERLRESKPDK